MIEIDVNNGRNIVLEQDRPNEEVIYKSYNNASYMLEEEIVIKPSEVVDLINLVISSRNKKMSVNEYLDVLFTLEDREENNKTL